MLTALKIKTAKPAERAYKLADAGGLFLLVQPNGSKLWRYKFRLQGVEGLQALGSFPEVGLADARAAHSASRHLVASGINPVQARRAERESRAIASMRRTKGSFEALCADWDAATSAGLRPATVGQRRREIDKDLLPVFRGRPVASITRLELTTTLKAVEARAPEVARNLRNHLWGIFEHAIDSGLIEDNPVPPVRVLRKRNQQNHPALDPSELPGVSAYLDSLATAWKAGEVRPTHRRKASEARWWRTRADPFEHAWPVVEDRADDLVLAVVPRAGLAHRPTKCCEISGALMSYQERRVRLTHRFNFR